MKTPNIKVVRTWLLTIFAVILIVYGLIQPDAATVMVGFSSLGVEPMYRAANGGKEA